MVPHGTPLVEGRLVERYDRFVADVRLPGGGVERTHCVNPGRMEGLVRPGARVWISAAPPERKRKLRWTLELIEPEPGLIVGANTAAPNRIARAALEARVVRGLTAFDALVPERAYGAGSRVDFWLRRGRRETFVEVKNCHLVYADGRGYFPDSVSDRATRHLGELVEVAAAGHRAYVLFTVQHPGARAIRPSDVHDPAFAAAVRAAARAGVRFRALRVRPTPEAYVVEGPVPVDVRPYGTRRQRAWRAANDATSGWRRRDMARGGRR